MSEGRFELEKGSYRWDDGKYQGGGQLPPGWFNSPAEEDPGFMRRGDTPLPPPPPPPERPPDPVPSEAPPVPPRRPNPAQTFSQPVRPPATDFVDLVSQKARFLGHDIDLSDDGRESIKMILAMEIDAALERERARVRDAVFQPDLQPTGSATGPDVPEVPGPKGAVES